MNLWIGSVSQTKWGETLAKNKPTPVGTNIKYSNLAINVGRFVIQINMRA